MIKVSVITVSYNSEKTIEDTIASVKSQSYKLIDSSLALNHLDVSKSL